MEVEKKNERRKDIQNYDNNNNKAEEIIVKKKKKEKKRNSIEWKKDPTDNHQKYNIFPQIFFMIYNIHESSICLMCFICWKSHSYVAYQIGSTEKLNSRFVCILWTFQMFKLYSPKQNNCMFLLMYFGLIFNAMSLSRLRKLHLIHTYGIILSVVNPYITGWPKIMWQHLKLFIQTFTK